MMGDERQLLLAVLLNQMVIMGALLHPDNPAVRDEVRKQMEHTKTVIDLVDRK